MTTTLPVIRCYCGVTHLPARTEDLDVTTRCECGRLLWPQVWGPR